MCSLLLAPRSMPHKLTLAHLYGGLFTGVRRETVWKLRGEHDVCLRSALWRARNTLRICPTRNGVASALIFPNPPEKGALGFTALRPILDAVFYVLKSGCPWRWLPKDFPPWKTVYDWFRR